MLKPNDLSSANVLAHYQAVRAQTRRGKSQGVQPVYVGREQSGVQWWQGWEQHHTVPSRGGSELGLELDVEMGLEGEE